MEINKIKNQSFGAIVFKFEAPLTKSQKKLVRKILKTDGLYRAEKKLEKQNTDIFITTRPLSDNVEMKLKTTIPNWFDMSFTPFDKLRTKMEATIRPDGMGIISADTAISNFVKRAGNVNINSPQNVSIRNKIIYGLKK